MTGIDCYYSGRTIHALVREGELLLRDGEWIGDHAKDPVTVGVQEYIATTDREDSGLTNPLVSWKDTDRILSKNVTDADGALRLLREEAAEKNGRPGIGSHSCFLCREYPE